MFKDFKLLVLVLVLVTFNIKEFITFIELDDIEFTVIVFIFAVFNTIKLLVVQLLEFKFVLIILLILAFVVVIFVEYKFEHVPITLFILYPTIELTFNEFVVTFVKEPDVAVMEFNERFVFTVKLPTVKLPNITVSLFTYKLLPIDIPPNTFNAPVPKLIESVVLVIVIKELTANCDPL